MPSDEGPEQPLGSPPERKALSARLRFEIFKRDKFTCQYCGRKAPEVVLNCDHIEPVVRGGTDDILNLITSCKACNGGKGAVPLSDGTAMMKQQEMLAELEERRQQIDMMLKWRDELRAFSSDAVDIVVQRIGERGPYIPNEAGQADIRRWLKKYTLDEIIEATDEAFDLYLQFNKNEVDTESWNKAFHKIPNIASMNKQSKGKPYLPKLLYIQGIIRRRAKMYRYNCVEYLEHLHLCGISLDDLESSAKKIYDGIKDFEGPYDAWLNKIGKPF